MASEIKKLMWFERGAASYARTRVVYLTEKLYPCPICLQLFTVDGLTAKSLTVEHVPPKSVGGNELLLTCASCNNIAGAKLDADARTEEDVHLAMGGNARRSHRVVATIAGRKINGQLNAQGGAYSLTVPARINKPDTRAFLHQTVRAGASITLEHERYAELGANISWFRAGYLALVAAFGFEVAFDPAMEIVRRQILEYDDRRMVTFMTIAQGDFPGSERRILRIIVPTWKSGWAVQFGRRFLNYPSRGDLSFYDRLEKYGAGSGVEMTTYEYVGRPEPARFGMPEAA